MAHNFKCLSNFVHRQPVSISAVFDQHQSNPVRSTFIPFDPLAQTKRQDLSHALCTHTHTYTQRHTHAKTLYHEPRHTRTAQGLRSHTRNFFGHSLPRQQLFGCRLDDYQHWKDDDYRQHTRIEVSRVCCADVVCCPGTVGRGGRRSAWAPAPSHFCASAVQTKVKKLHNQVEKGKPREYISADADVCL